MTRKNNTLQIDFESIRYSSHILIAPWLVQKLEKIQIDISSLLLIPPIDGWNDSDYVEAGFTGYAISKFMVSNISNGIITIDIPKEMQDRTTQPICEMMIRVTSNKNHASVVGRWDVSFAKFDRGLRAKTAVIDEMHEHPIHK